MVEHTPPLPEQYQMKTAEKLQKKFWGKFCHPKNSIPMQTTNQGWENRYLSHMLRNSEQTGGVAQMADSLLCEVKTLCLNPNTTKKKKKKPSELNF
jgi:hypothetical protein